VREGHLVKELLDGEGTLGRRSLLGGRRALATLTALTVVGCSAIFDVGDYDVGAGIDAGPGTDGGDDTDAGPAIDGGGEDTDGGAFDSGVDAGTFDASPDGGPPCPAATHRCVPPAPSPFIGPVALTNPSTPCAGAFPSQEIDLFANLVPGAASCSCVCGSPTQACPTTFQIVGFSGNSCNVPEGTASVGQRMCYSNGSIDSLSVDLVGSAGATCARGTVNPNISTPTWDTEVRACDGFADGPGACPTLGDRCVPSPADPFNAGRLCVYATGDQICPAGYPDKTLLNTGFTDNRTCPGDCTCTSQGASCRSLVTRYPGTNCSGSTSPSIEVTNAGGGRCMGAVNSVRPGTVLGTPGSCRPATVSVTGGATPNGLHTVCCSDP
jgi:hypothetical protein